MKLSLRRPLKWEVYCREDDTSLAHWQYKSKKKAVDHAARMNYTSRILCAGRRYGVREIPEDEQ